MQIGLAAFATLASLISATEAFEITFPNNNGGYWVSNYTNTLNWKANSTDPEFFSVQLLNANSSSLNGNFQIGNALLTSNGTAQIFIDRIPSGTYSLLFVNSSNYQLDQPQVYFTSSQFELRPNGTEPAAVTANTNADPNSSATMAATGSATATLSSASSTGTGTGASQGSKNSANGMKYAGAMTTVAAASAMCIVVGLGVGVGMLA